VQHFAVCGIDEGVAVFQIQPVWGYVSGLVGEKEQATATA
jgi:hypothetical protein